MAITDIFKRNRDRPNTPETPIVGGRMSGRSEKSTTLSPHRSRTSDTLETLRRIPEQTAAIEFLKKVNPDVSMALWNFVRLANQGHTMEFYSASGKKRLTEVEDMWREFAARIYEISNSGLDGLIDTLHHSAYMLGAMGTEVEVAPDLTDITEVHVIKPQTIEWKLEDRNGREVWIPYQHQAFKPVSLEKGKANFFWCPVDPDIDDPRGNLIMAPVLQAVDFQMQILNDLQAVLHHQGWPRNDISINLERLMTTMPPGIKNDKKKTAEWLDENWTRIIRLLKRIGPDDDYVHYDDMTINMNQGANAGRSLDVRAVSELVDIQTLSGAKQMAIFMNRNQGITESWGTVQFRIFCSGVASIQRGSKRLVEEMARLWLRVNGIQATPKFTHNTIDWNSEEQRMTVNLLKEEFYQIAQLMGWIDADTAAQEVMGAEKATGTPAPAYTGEREPTESGNEDGGNAERKFSLGRWRSWYDRVNQPKGSIPVGNKTES